MSLATGSILDKGNQRPDAYAAWGNQAQTAQGQGWYPETSYNGETTYRSNFSPVFNDVVIPDTPNEKGHIALIGNNNHQFNVVIRDKKGNVRHTIFKGISPDEVQNYLTKATGNVAMRNNSVLRRTMPTSIIASK